LVGVPITMIDGSKHKWRKSGAVVLQGTGMNGNITLCALQNTRLGRMRLAFHKLFCWSVC
jgi:hypothetical protein